MKAILTLFLFSLPLLISAQQFLDTTKTWSVLECSTGGSTVCGTNKYKLVTDTVINGVTIFELYFSPDSLGMNWYSTMNTLSEDTINKKVFFNSEPNPLYDFLLNKGDTVFPGGPFGSNCNPFVVDSVDTFVYFGTPRRRIIFDQTGVGADYIMWIDGIGSTDGIIQCFIRYCMVDADARLLCCDSAGSRIYQSSLYNSCYVVLSTDDLERGSAITMTPNPFNDRLHFKSSLPEANLVLEIFDPIVRSVFKANVSSMEQDIVLPTLANGIFYISIRNEKINYLKKMVKTGPN